MLTVHQITKSYNLNLILNQVSFRLLPGQRLGLVGHNGTGKTTLLRIIIGEERPDSGTVQFNPADLRLGYLPQGQIEQLGETIGGFLDRLQGDPDRLAERLADLGTALAARPNDAALQAEYDDTLARLESAAEGTGDAAAVLAGLELDRFDRATPVAHLSGGQKTRLALAGVLLSRPQLLLLDEPTNHLDVAMLEWLETWLFNYPGGALIVSHDRAFLDRAATGILEIDPIERTLKAYEGNYSDYLEAKENERARQWQAYLDQQAKIARLKVAAAQVRRRARFRKGGKADPENTDGFSAGFFADRSKETVHKAKHIEKRIERLLNEERVDKPGRTWQMRVDFQATADTGRDVLVLEDLAVGYGETPLSSEINAVLRYGARAVLVGPNGIGKTTLLRTIAGQIQPLGGRVRLGSKVKIGYMAQEQETLDGDATPLSTIEKVTALSETETRALLSKFLFKGDDVFAPVGKLSFGERARLSLAVLVAQGCNFLLLDEPINHLDIPSRASFEQALSAFEGTVLAVVHDRYFIAGFASELWELSPGGIRRSGRLSEPLG